MAHSKVLFTYDHECSCCFTYSFTDVLDFSYQFLSALRYAQIMFLEVVMRKHRKLRIKIAGLNASVWIRDIQNYNFFPWPFAQFSKTKLQWSTADWKHKYCVSYIYIYIYIYIYTGCFIMFSVITNIYNKKTKGPTIMEFFTATRKLKKFFFYN